MTTRRAFIRTGCLGCAGLMAAGLALQGCGTAMPMLKTTAKDKKINIPVSAFAEGKTMLIVRTPELENDILVVKKEDSYYALYLQCTHEGVGLTPTSKKIICTAHGSVFDFDGNVVKEPALKPLKKFSTEIQNANIIIHLT